MKNLKYSIVSIFALCSAMYAGPNIKSITDYDAEDMKKAESAIKKPHEQKQKLPQIPAVVTGTKNSKEEVPDITFVKEAKKSDNEVPDLVKNKSVVKKQSGYKKGFDFRKKRVVDESIGFGKAEQKSSYKKGFKRNNFYIGLGLTALGIDSDETATIFTNSDTQDRQIGFTLKLGYNIFEYLSAEIRGTYGIVNEADETKFKNAAFYLKPNYKLNNDMTLYALVGYGSSNLQGDDVNGAGLSYGFGAKYYTFSSSGIYCDLVNYLSKSDSNSMWGLNIGVVAEF